MNSPDNQSKDRNAQLERNAYWISLVTGVLMLIVAIASTIATIQTRLYAFSGVFLTVFISGIAFYSAFLSRRKNSTRGILLLLGVILLLSLSLPAIAKGEGLAMGILVTIIVSGIASSTLKSDTAFRATVAGILVGILVVVVDLYTPAGFGTPTDQRFALPAAIGLTIVYAIFLITRFQSFSLRTKLILAFIAVCLLPLSILGYQGYRSIANLLTVDTNNHLLNNASLTANNLDNFIDNELNSVRVQALIAEFSDYLSIPASSSSVNLAAQGRRVSSTMQSLLQKDPVYLLSYSLINSKGIDVLDTSPTEVGTNKGSQDYFLGAVGGVPYLGGVRFSSSTGDANLFFSAPVRTNVGTVVGVLVVRYSASILQQLLNQTLSSNNTNEFAVLVDNKYQINLASTNNPSSNYKSYGNLTPEQARLLQSSGRLTQGLFKDVVIPFAERVGQINNIDNSPVFNTKDTSSGGENIIAAGVRLKNLPEWVVLMEQPESAALAPVTNQTRTSIILSLLMALVAVSTAVAVSQILSAPITSLTRAAEKVSSGDLSVYAENKSQDEIGVLTNTFNDMTAQIRQTLGGLERRVKERTEDLEKAKEATENRARALESISEVSRIIATEQNLDKLLPLITNLISSRFNFYHVGIFLLDDSQTYAVLRAANSTGGQRMLARSHKLEVGLTGLVGYVAQKGYPRIALDVGQDAVYFNNPDLPETRSEIALPLNLRKRTIGVLDVQSTASSAFTEADASTLNILAEQVAIAIDNTNLLSETQRALEDSQSLYRRFVSQTWEKRRTNEGFLGYTQGLGSGRRLERMVNSPGIEKALNQKETVILSENHGTSSTSVAVPIKIRDLVIGVLNINPVDKNRVWNQDEIGIMEAVSERVAFALENAQLLDDLQRRAARERSISEISTRISQANDIDGILRSTVEELGKKLRNTEIAIQINSSDGKGQ